MTEIDCPTCQDTKIVPDGPGNPFGNLCPDCGDDDGDYCRSRPVDLAADLDGLALPPGGSTMTPFTLAWSVWDPS